MRKGAVAGAILILIGMYLFIQQLFRLPDGIGLAFIGAALLTVRIIRGRNYGFTIAGCLAIAVGLYSAIEDIGLLGRLRLDVLEGALMLFLLALAFFTIHIIEQPRIGNWPIVPGICLLVVGVVSVVAQNPNLYGGLWKLWPLALICVGASMLVGRRGGRAKQAYRDNWGYHADGGPPPDGPERPQQDAWRQPPLDGDQKEE